MPKGYSQYNQGRWYHTKEQKEHLRIAALNRPPISEETRLKMRQAHLGKHYHSEEHKQRMSKRMAGINNPMFGKANTPEMKAKISASLKAFWQEHPEIRARCGRQGMPHTEETKTKMSIAALANHGNSQLQMGEKNHFYGKHHRIETIQKISEALIGQLVAEKNPSWKGGIGRLPYPFKFDRELKESIRERDNHICQLCGVPEAECLRILDVHHIDYNKENINKENLISLCRSCNTKVNVNRGYWQGYFVGIIAEIYARKGGD